MKKFLVTIIFFVCQFSNAQLVSQINEALKIPDSLGWKKEIRIYEFAALTNYRSLVRLYQDDDKNWKVEYWKYYYVLNKPEHTKVEFVPIYSATNFEVLWLNILNSNIKYLPKWKEIEYKLKIIGQIKIDRGEYVNTWEKKEIADGNSYMIEIRDNEDFNLIMYPNPKEYFKYYPKVDELESINQLLDYIQTQFKLN